MQTYLLMEYCFIWTWRNFGFWWFEKY